MNSDSPLKWPINSTREASYEVGRIAEKRLGRKLTHVPFNRFDKIDESTWWLSPSNEIPAYRHGKIAFTREYFAPEMFIGLYVEKGLNREFADAAFPGKGWGMDSTWQWHKFWTDLKAGALTRA